MTPSFVLYILDLAGVAVFAASGVLATRDRQLDLLGVVIVATLTAIGGGTVRDLLLDRHPIFWIVDNTYLVVILISALSTSAWLRWRTTPGFVFLVADSMGLAVFAMSGASLAMAAGHSVLIVVLMGTMSGVVGGILRDIVTVHVPLILRREIYATAAIVGILVYWGLLRLEAPQLAAYAAGILVVVGLRVFSFRRGLHLPSLN